MKTLTTGFLALTLAATTLTGCSDDPGSVTGTGGEQEPAAPQVPPPAVFDFDFQRFDTPEARAFAASGGDLERADVTRLNWLNAAIRVLYLDAVLTKALTPPATVLAIALHQPPTYEGQGTWLWSFDYTDDAGAEVSVRLYGTVDTVAEIVTWEMVVSSNEHDPVLVDFLWFEGETSLVRDEGFLLFHQTDGRDAGRMEWAVDGTQRTLEFRNLDTQSEDLGDMIRYTVDAEAIEVRVHDASALTDTVIEWNDVTGAGSIVAPEYNDGERACWDEHLFDVTCEEMAS